LILAFIIAMTTYHSMYFSCISEWGWFRQWQWVWWQWWLFQESLQTS